MSTLSLIILILLSLVALYCMNGQGGSGVKNNIVRNSIGIYILILGLISLTKVSSGLIQGFYLGILSVVLSIFTLFIFKKNYKQCRVLNSIGIIIATFATYFSYLN